MGRKLTTWTAAKAKFSRASTKCPVCGTAKGRDRLFCYECAAELMQQDRNVAPASADGYMDVVRQLRTKRDAAKIGLKLVPPN
jgi:hypothetical protein